MGSRSSGCGRPTGRARLDLNRRHRQGTTEAYLTGNPEKDQAIVKLSPGKQGSNAAYNYVDELTKRNAT